MDPASSSPPVLDGFASTAWSVVLAAAGHGSDAQRRQALESLCRAYWRPVFLYARRLKLTAHDAEDATQGFFAFLLDAAWIERVRPERGSFRGFLLSTFRQFLSNERQKAAAAKRGHGAARVPIDLATAEAFVDEALHTNRDPADDYERAFALTLMERATTRLAAEQTAAGQAKAFTLLRRFIQAPPAPGDYDRVAKELGLARGTIAVLVHRLGKRYRDLVRAEVNNTVADPAHLKEELRHLLAAIGK